MPKKATRSLGQQLQHTKKATRSLGQQLQHTKGDAEEENLNHTNNTASCLIVYACCRERQMEATRSSAQRRRAEDAEEDRIEEEARQQRLAEEEAARQAEEARLKVGQAGGASVMYIWHCSVTLYPVCSLHNMLNMFNKRLSLGAWQRMGLAAVSALRALQHPRHMHKMLVG